ncbi:MAG: AAA family ATPase [Fimbriimonadales bacterium]|jgi:proteasome-associated ATPase|nr:AAA family ATPase [Fimbriimonadales bacterium]CUU10945.1 proteasome-associated ATPase [Armatimonadetes bacterium GBS]CUU33666.1 proteasome-associated ATPase [Armatimonadetes bacterium GXS]
MARRYDYDDEFELPETQLRALGILEEIMRIAPRTDLRLIQLLRLLKHQLEVDEKQMQEAMQALQEYEEAYQKLTSPANRIGVFLDQPEEGVAMIALGDSEYYANIDPKLENPNFRVGTRVKVNEAFAVIGDLGYHPAGPIVKVQEVIDEKRLRVANDPQGMTSRIVFRSSDLMGQLIKPGDEVRIEPNFKVAIEHIPHQEVRDYYFEEVPPIEWSQIGGQEEAIRLIRETIELPLLHPEIYKKFDKQPLKGILLYGPPGCGKTLIGKATAYNLTRQYSERLGRPVKEYFMYISGPKILNMWLGETERMVREIFAIAREKAKEGYLVFIFIDEAESILRTRSSGRWLNISNTVVPQFCAEMDGLVSLENVVVLLTSNRPDYIDPAILRPGRIDRKVKVRRPDRDATREIFGIYLHENLPLDPAFVSEYDSYQEARECLIEQAVQYLWRKAPDTEFLQVYLRNGGVETLYWRDLVSGALIKSVVDRAKEYAIRRAIEEPNAEHGIRPDDLKRAIEREYAENEIFPKSDVMEDWLKLIDYEPEYVASVKPIRPNAQMDDGRNRVI